MAKRLSKEEIGNLEFCDIIKGGNTVLTIKPTDLKKNFDFRDIELLIGKKIGSGKYRYVLKLKTYPDRFNGSIRGVTTIDDKKQNVLEPISNNGNMETILFNKLQELENKVLNQTNPDYQQSIQNLKDGYQLRIDILNDRINELKSSNNDYKAEIKRLENEVKKLESELAESGGGLESLFQPMLQQYMAKKFGGKDATPLSDLSSSNTTDIPENILQILGMVDYAKITPGQMQQIEHNLKIWIKLLPLKQ